MDRHRAAGVALLADIEERTDVRMVQGGHGSGLALETRAQILTLGDMVW